MTRAILLLVVLASVVVGIVTTFWVPVVILGFFGVVFGLVFIFAAIDDWVDRGE